MRQFLWVLLAAIVLSSGLFLALSRQAGRGTVNAGLSPGEEAPPLKAAGWVNGGPPADRSNHVVVVDAWATWCGPCRRTAPHLVEVYEQYRDRGVAFVGLTAEGEEDLPQIRAFLDDVGITWPNGYGARETLSRFEVTAIPAYWVISPKGKVVWNRNSGPLEEGIEKALAEREN